MILLNILISLFSSAYSDVSAQDYKVDRVRVAIITLASRLRMMRPPSSSPSSRRKPLVGYYTAVIRGKTGAQLYAQVVSVLQMTMCFLRRLIWWRPSLLSPLGESLMLDSMNLDSELPVIPLDSS